MSFPFTHGIDLRGNQSAYNTLTAAVALSVPDGATHCVIQAHTKAIWYTIDGTTPTAAAPAFYIAAGDSDAPRLPEGLDAVRIIENEASATISYLFVADRGA